MHRRSVALNRRLHDQARILNAAVVLMDGRSSQARDYKQLARLMLDARSQIDALQTALNMKRGR
jgi:uncharacterized protein (DUF2384 family)